MRWKHIFIPIVALGLIGAYSSYHKTQAAKFNSDIWIAAMSADSDFKRRDMLAPLMGHVLKVGMSMTEVRELLGPPDEERSFGHVGLFEPSGAFYYGVNKRTRGETRLVVTFNHNMIVMDFYAEGEKRAFIN